MNDEEIDMLIANAEYEPQQLKNYITNLQQENKDYKTRCDKAIKKINQYELIVGYYDYNDDGYYEIGENNKLQEELQNILEGKDNE